MIALLLSLTLCSGSPDLAQIFSPCVRISMSSGSTGSGIVVYAGEGESLILTAAHLFQDGNEDVSVDVFEREESGEILGVKTFPGCLVARDENEDLAVLVVDVRLSHVARILPEYKHLRVMQRVTAVGCPKGLFPVATRGRIFFLGKAWFDLRYIGATANIFLGNSGGPLLVKVDGEWFMAGVASRIQSNIFTGQVITHLGYYVSPERIREFILNHGLVCILDQ